VADDQSGLPDIIDLRGVSKAYDVGTPIETEMLHDINLTLKAGDFCALMGPSGSGKSTLLNIIGLLDRPTRGRILIHGEDVGALDDSGLTHLRGQRIGFVFQHHHLIPAFTALENVMMPMLLAREFPDDAMRARAETLLDQVGLTRWKDNKATNMSGGQQQRVAVARALVMKPALILADEPTGNLDTKSANEVFDLLRELNRSTGAAILMVTHNDQMAHRCDYIREVIDGRLIDRPAPA
jgi:lipoprotein-releasing system ATP-binding protein